MKNTFIFIAVLYKILFYRSKNSDITTTGNHLY